MQTIAGFILCDILEHGLPRKWYIKLMNWWHRPNVTKFTCESIHPSIIINEYPENLNIDQFEPIIRPLHDACSRTDAPLLRKINQNTSSSEDIKIPSCLHDKFSSTGDISLAYSEKFNEPMEKVVATPAKPPTPPMLKRP
jgi:hypothetical protein